MTSWSQQAGIALDRSADVPIGVQLGWHLRARILAGILRPGTRLPGLRDLARELEINPNTVRSVYGRLEQDGLVETRQGSGSFVLAPPPEQVALGYALDNAAEAAREAGIDLRELAAALYVGGPEAGGSDTERARRRLLRSQIAAFEQTLTELHARRRSAPTPDPAGDRTEGPRLLTAEELEQRRDDMLRRLANAGAPVRDEASAPEQGGAAGRSPAASRSLRTAPGAS